MWKVTHATKTAEFVAATKDVWHYRFHTKVSTYAVYGDSVGTVASQDSTTLTLNISGKHIDVPRSKCIGLSYWKVVRANDATPILADIDPQDMAVTETAPAPKGKVDAMPVHMPSVVSSATARQKPKRLKKPSHRNTPYFKQI